MENKTVVISVGLFNMFDFGRKKSVYFATAYVFLCFCILGVGWIVRKPQKIPNAGERPFCLLFPQECVPLQLI